MSRLILFSALSLLVISNFVHARRPRGSWSSPRQTQNFLRNPFGYPIVNDNTFANISNPIVVLKDGILKGFVMKTITGRPIAAFQSIPFAKPPVGALRFKEPRKNLPWIGIRDATVRSPECVQIDTARQNESLGQEDCLYLNVYTPQTILDTSKLRGVNDSRVQRLPVLLFIHGGKYSSGAGILFGPRYLLDRNVVLVTINYRLGALGFLSTGDDASPGNNGLKDQVAALNWVRENILMFGGDPNSVTIFGQSAGAAAVQFHITSPLSRGLFHRGISQSGLRVCWWTISQRATTLAKRTAERFNCGGSSEQMVECLRHIDAHELTNSERDLIEWASFPIAIFAPVIEHQHPGAFLIERPEETYRRNQAARVPWITGYTRYEMSWLFADFLQNKTAVSELNSDWERLGEVFLTIRNATGSNSTIATKIRDYYLGGDTEISFRNRNPIVVMLGDRYFLPCAVDAMDHHSRYTGEPVYAYEFSYEGKYSVVEDAGQNASDWGVAHIDDLIYLLNSTEYYPTINIDDAELSMSNILTGIWSNFAQYGKPYINQDGQLTDIWQPITRNANSSSTLQAFQFLDLNLTPTMIDNPYTERYNFWKSLQLTD